MSQAYQIISAGGIDALALCQREVPLPLANEVIVKVKAVALNYRDLSTTLDPKSRAVRYPLIPCSDAAGEIIALGSDVIDWKIGDTVISSFFQNWPGGPISNATMANALGGSVDGVLAEHVRLKATGIAAKPKNLSFLQAATLPCAGLTAWRCLVEFGQICAGQTVLLLGTGGVSIFALQFARANGARVIITSGDNAKLARARELGAHETINYRQNPQWDQTVLDLTGGRGVDLVVEVGGAGTLARSCNACRIGGKIALIGILSNGQFDPTTIMRRSINLQGIYVGSDDMFNRMAAALEAGNIKPVIDEVFSFADARQAFHRMLAANHFGKLVIEVDG